MTCSTPATRHDSCAEVVKTAPTVARQTDSVDLTRPWREYPSAAEMSARTPPARDRVVDLVRAFSLVVVVFGHSFMAQVAFVDGGVELGNTLAQTRWLQPATWVLQVMPLFFAAGAWANALSYRKAAAYPQWLNARVRRLVRPVIAYTGFWIIASPLLLAWNYGIALALLRISTQLLWFLGAYLLVTALTPLLMRLSTRPVLACAGWLMGALLVDGIRLAGGPSAIGLANFVLVWALAGQTGLWAFSTRHRPSVPAAVALIAAGIGTNALLVGFGPWPLSLVGLSTDEISNMAPPSVVLAIHCIVLAGLVVVAYSWLTRVSQWEWVWRPTAVVNAAAMTIYLWHLAAMILALSVLAGTGQDLPGFSGGSWLWPRLEFWLLFAALTFGLVWLMRPFEHIPLPWWDAPVKLHPMQSWPYRLRSSVSVVGVVLLAAGLLALSVTGLVGFPFGVTSSYAGFEFTPGLSILVALAGIGLIRAGAVGVDRSGSSLAAGFE